MAWTPITGSFLQYGENDVDAAGYYLKFYASGTTTPISMATDSTGGTTLAKCELDSDGMPINASGGDLIPFIDQKYKLVIYRNAADADANTFANAYKEVDNIDPFITTVDEAPKVFDTLALAKAATFSLGGWVETKGRKTKGDGGNAKYLVEALGTPDGYVDHATDDGNSQLTLQVSGAPWAKQCGATGDGVTNDSPAIQAALNAFGVVLFDESTYLLGTALSLASNDKIVGMGESTSILTVSAADVSAITIDSNARNTLIQGLSITYSGATSTTNVGIHYDEVNGGEGHVINRAHINSFGYGMKMKEIWWGNTVQDVRLNTCNHSIYSNSTGGQSINNNFINVYSNNPITRGLSVTTGKTWVFTSCNFGLHPSSTVASGYMDLLSVCQGFKFIGCNFESSGGTIPAGEAGVTIRSNSTVEFSSCTFQANAGASATAREIRLRDNAEAIISNVIFVAQGANIGKYYATNSSKFIFVDADESELYDLSSVDSVFLSTPDLYSTGSNGETVKFPNGLMIVTEQKTSQGSSTITLPDTFVGQYSIAVTNESANDRIFSTYTKTGNSFYLRVMDSAGVVTTTNLSYIAVGRWK